MINKILRKIAQDQVKRMLAVSSMVPNPSGSVNKEDTHFTTPPTSSIGPQTK